MPQKWDSVKIKHETYENLIVLKSTAEKALKRNVTLAEVFEAVVNAELRNTVKAGYEFITDERRE